MRRTTILGTCAAALLLSACNSSDDDDTPPPPQFSEFVTDLIDSTADDTEPVSIDDRTFTFSEDPATFDALFE